jgi:hypothetical protein
MFPVYIHKKRGEGFSVSQTQALVVPGSRSDTGRRSANPAARNATQRRRSVPHCCTRKRRKERAALHTLQQQYRVGVCLGHGYKRQDI